MTNKVSSPRIITRGKLKIVAIIAVIVTISVVVFGIASRNAEVSNLTQWTEDQTIPSVKVIQPYTTSKGDSLALPGRLEAFYRAPIYARVSGYLKAWYADIGAHVTEGQVLGIIETPDLDHQLEQAKADLASAKANEALAKSTAERWALMLKADSVSQQAADEKNGDWAAKQALVTASAANVDRLETLEGFKRIVAPFDGIVTSRSTDIGALIDAGSGQGPQLFTVSDVHRLRAYVNVPQDVAPSIHQGMNALITLPGSTHAGVTASVASTSGAVNAESGTLLVELSVSDNSGSLMPGDFVNVRFDFSGDSKTMRLPASCLIFRSAGLQIAVLDSTNRVSLRNITVKQDLGSWIEVASGVNPDDRIVDSPPDALSDGDQVRASTPTTTSSSIGQ